MIRKTARFNASKTSTKKSVAREASAIDHNEWWFGRKQAAGLLGVSERTVYNRGKNGKIKTAVVYGRLKYKVETSPQSMAGVVLPLQHFRINSTFVAWITFTSDACQNNWKSIEQWSKDMKDMIEEYIKKNITREDVSAMQAVRTKSNAKSKYVEVTGMRSRLDIKRKYVDVTSVFSPSRPTGMPVEGAPRLR